MALVPGVLESGSLAACSTSCGHNNEGSGSNCKALSDHPPAFLLPNPLALLLPISRLGSMRAPAWPVLVGLGSRQVQLAEVVGQESTEARVRKERRLPAERLGSKRFVFSTGELQPQQHGAKLHLLLLWSFPAACRPPLACTSSWMNGKWSESNVWVRQVGSISLCTMETGSTPLPVQTAWCCRT